MVAVAPEWLEVFAQHAQFQVAPGTTISRIGMSEGWPVVQLTLRAARAASALVLGHGDHARIIDPPELIERTVVLARAAVAGHTGTAARTVTPDELRPGQG